MKHREEYFTSSNIERKTGEYLARLKRRKRNFRLGDSALLLVDLQEYFLNDRSPAFIPSSKAIVPGLLRLRDFYRQAGRPVIFTRHLDIPGEGMMESWWGSLILEQDPLSRLSPEVFYPEGLVINKSQYDAFYKTGLERLLRDQGVEQLVVAGVMTNLCCETTARSAFLRGFEVFFPVDASAAYNEEFHWGSLLNLAYGFVEPVSCRELLASGRKNEN